MDLTFSDEQEALREAVRGLCETSATGEAIRALEDDPTGYDPDFWRGLAQMDLCGLTVPPEHGGSGMGALETVVLYEELGRSLAPSPHFVSCVLAARLLTDQGTAAQQDAWLPRIARGEAIVTVAWHEPEASSDPAGIRLTATAVGDDQRLDGTKIMVPFASSADLLLTLARTGDGRGGLDWFLVPADADGLTLIQTHTLASDARYEVRFDGVTLPGAARLGHEPGAGWDAVTDAMVDGLIALAAEAVGGTEAALDAAIRYAKEREQFGRPIGGFQGLAHPVADMATELEGAKTLTRQAAWARDNGRRAAPLAAMAKLYACDVYRRATRVGHQVFGGIGFTRAIDMQLYFRRARQLEVTWLDPRSLTEQVAAAELDGDAGFVGIDAGV